MANSLNIPKSIYIYNEDIKGINFKGLESFVKKNLGKIPVKVIKLKERVVETKGLLFEGTAPIFLKRRINKNRRCPYFKKACHIILTDKLFATFDEDKKLHIRASIYSFPSVISTSGIIEGPAKPKEYYLYKDRFVKLGAWEIEEPKVKKRFKNRFIDYGDRRINEVLKGYISQAIFFYMTGEPFCDRRDCRLFNAHWQEDLIYSQIKIGSFCLKHRKILKELGKVVRKNT